MKPALTTASLAALFLLISSSHAQLLPFLTNNKPSTPDRIQNYNQRPMAAQPINPGIQLPPSQNDDNNNKNNPSGGNDGSPKGSIILSDVLGTHPQIQIFAGFTQDVTTIAARLDTASQNTTLLAPLNKAITSLPRKPWEDPRDYGALGPNAYSGAEGEDRAHRNLRRFAEAHVLPVSPWEEGVKVQTLLGSTVWWEKREGGKMVVMPGEIAVKEVVGKVRNGEIWVLDGVVNYA